MKLRELHDWHMFLTADQLGVNVNAKVAVDEFTFMACSLTAT